MVKAMGNAHQARHIQQVHNNLNELTIEFLDEEGVFLQKSNNGEVESLLCLYQLKKIDPKARSWLGNELTMAVIRQKMRFLDPASGYNLIS